MVGLSAFSLYFQSEEVRRLVEAFEARYGRWTRVEEKEVVTREGGRLPNAQWVWEFRHVTVRISQLGRELGNAQASVNVRVADDEYRARIEARKRGGGKGL